jgi:transcriptional regulator with XRE-family HTH domain
MERKMELMKKPLNPAAAVHLNKRIKKVRQAKGWTQEQLAEKIGISQKQVSAYERGTYNPSTEVLLKLAEALDVSLDYLVFERNDQNPNSEIKDRELIRYFGAIDNLGEKDRRTVKEILDLVLMRGKIKEMAEK